MGRNLLNEAQRKTQRRELGRVAQLRRIGYRRYRNPARDADAKFEAEVSIRCQAQDSEHVAVRKRLRRIRPHLHPTTEKERTFDGVENEGFQPEAVVESRTLWLMGQTKPTRFPSAALQV